MNNSPRCWDGGYLVGKGDWLPTDPRDHYAALGPFIGCNALGCSACGQPVRNLLGYWQAPKIPAAALYAVPRWQDIPALAPQPASGRLYGCACESLVVTATKRLIPAPDDLDPDQLPPWRCQGHPTLELPGRLDEIELPATVDWDALVAANIAISGTPPLHPNVDGIPGFFLTRVYVALAEESSRARLSTAAGRLADSPDRETRTGVSVFFAMNRRAEGLDALVEAWKRTPALYDHQPSPWASEPTLRHLILKAVVARLRIHRKLNQPSADDLATLRWAALSAPGLGSYVHSMASIDPDWATSHFAAMLSAQPTEWGAVLWAVRPPLDALVDASRWLVSSHHATREELLRVVEEKYPDWSAQVAHVLVEA